MTTALAEPDAIAVTHDAFLGGAVYAHQPRHGYRAGMDAVLLAACIPSTGQPQNFRSQNLHEQTVRVLDVGAGVGVVGLCAAARLPNIDVTMVEQSPELCALSHRNISENGLAHRVRIVELDVADSGSKGHPQLVDNSFDVVVSNPPFYEDARHRRSPHALKAASHAMPDAGLDAWLRYMARMTRAGGVALLIHRADQLAELLAAMSPRFGAITVQPLHPRGGEPASRVILRGIKGSRAPLRIRPGVSVHGAGNSFTPAVDKILKTPAPLDLDAHAS